MRGRIALFLCLALTVSVAATAVAGTWVKEEWVDLDPGLLTLDSRDGLLTVDYAGATGAGSIGAPDLPVLPVWIEIPADARVVAVDALAEDVVEVASQVRIAPLAADRRPGEPAVPVSPDAAFYDQAEPYPATWAMQGVTGALRGHRVVAVLVHPLRWEPASGRLLMASRLRLRLELADGASSPMLTRNRVVPAIEERYERSVSSTVRGFQSLAGRAAATRAGSGPAGDGPFQPTFRPTTDGSAVEYLIITNQEMAAEFQRLADWKTAKGVQAVVRTTEWIDASYPNGVDQAERIRFFIRDAYQNWGTLWLLLAGDTDVIPARYAYFAFVGGAMIPADYYFGCLDDNWNGDGDWRFGEANNLLGGDSADLFSEVSVGRAPVSFASQAAGYIDKLIAFENDIPDHPRFPASLLAMAERLFVDEHGADIAEEVVAMMPSIFHVVRLYEEAASYPGSIEITREACIDSLENGFGLVLHVGHGYRNTMSVGDGTLGNADADNMTNGPRNSIVFAINCSSAAIDFNSIGERWIKNPNGGSVAYVGTSRIAYVIASRLFQEAWFEAVFDDSVRSVGLATDAARLALVPQAINDSAWRWNLLATTVLGDPEVRLYANEVVPLDVAHPASFTLGDGTMTVVAISSGHPVAGARVSLVRDGEAYGHGETDATGAVTIDFRPQTPGDVELTVTLSPYRAYQTTIPAVATASPFLHADGQTVDDDSSGSSSGDGDGVPDAGETIEVTVTLKNGGSSTATSVVGTLSVQDPEAAVTILDDTVSYGTIAAGAADDGSSTFLIAIDPAAPVAYQPIFELSISASQGSWDDLFVLGFRRPYLEHYAHLVDDSVPRGNGNGMVEAGEEIWYSIDLRNTGQDDATGVAGELRVLAVADSQPHPLVTVLDNQTAPGSIPIGNTVTGDRFEFALDGTVDPADILLEVTWDDDLGPVRVELLDVIPPAPGDTLKAFGSASSITLRWERPEDEDVKGYDIFRADGPGGPFVRVNQFTADGSAAYEDQGLPPLTRFYYQVVARDSSYNHSVASEVISGTTNPPLAPGWPIEIAQQSQSSATLANTSGDDALEIFTAGDYEYGWHFDGTEIVDGDGDERTNGVYSRWGFDQTKGFSATTAIGDLDRDTDLEVANVGWSRDSLYVWDHQGALLWRKWLMDDFNWPSPVMADLDGDHYLEVVVWAGKGGRLFAWHHDGTEVVDGDNNSATDGVMYRIYDVSYNYSSPAVANIDDDPEFEIIFCINRSGDSSGSIYVLNHDGTLAAGWPVATGSLATPSQITASPAVADLDNDGDYEIIVAADRAGGRVYVYNGDGTPYPGWPRSAGTEFGLGRSGSPVPVDLLGDAELEIVYPGSNGQLYAWNRAGAALPGFPVTYKTGSSESTQSTPSVGDVDGDGLLEILFGDESGMVHGYNQDGTQVNGFPIQLPGEVRSTPSIWDIDLDGLVEVVVQGWDTNMYVWDLPATFHPTLMPWPMFRHDSRNTGWTNVAALPNAVNDPGPATAPAFAPVVYPPYPNPFNPSTTLAFDVPGEGARQVEVAVFDTSGRLVRSLLRGPVDAGQHRLRWDGRTIRGGIAASGVYFYRVKIDSFQKTGKLVLVQ